MKMIAEGPLLYPAFVLPDQNQKVETFKIGLSAGWILLSICILVLLLVYILLSKSARSYKKKNGSLN